MQREYLLEGIAEISSSLYIRCNSGSSGGAIYVFNSNFILLLNFCSFLHCSSSSYGGAVAIYDNKRNSFFSNCFSMNSGQYCPDIVLYGYSYNVQLSENNNSNFYSPINTGHASCLISNQVYVVLNNFSNGYCTSGLAGGVYFGATESKELARFCQIVNVKAQSFIAIAMKGGYHNLSPTLSVSNFINNSVGSWVEIHNTVSYPNLDKCIFIMVPQVSTHIHAYISSGNPSFSQCSFDFEYDPIKYGNINNEQNTFSASLCEPNDIYGVMSFYCWENRTEKIKSHSYERSTLQMRHFQYIVLFIVQ